jgi:hypothetical protein
MSLPRPIRLAAAAFVLLSAAPSGTFAADTGLAWLESPPDARAAVMGQAVVSNVSDASSAIWNPAGLAAMEGGEGRVSHVESIADIRREFAALGRSFEGISIGAHFEGIWTENLDGYDEAGNFEGTFGYYGFAAGLAAGVSLGDNLRVGAGAKLIREAIDDESATGWAVDLGAQYALAQLPLTAGVAVLNLGPDMSYVSEEISLPTVVQAGATYSIDLPSFSGGVLVSGELRKVREQDASFLLGVEYRHQGLVSLGFGYRTADESRDVSLGFGFRRDRFSFDYAFVPFTESLIGDEHRLGLGVKIW